MVNLLKAELFKLRKDKALLVCAILVAGLSIFGTVIYAVAMNYMDRGPMSVITGRTNIYGSMSLINNGGFVILIAVPMVLCKDFSYGTIRNEIIAGHSKVNIYFSKLISGLIVILGLALLNVLVSIASSAILLDYGAPLDTREVLNLIRDISLGMLIYVWALSVSLIFIFLLKKSVLAILSTIGVLLLLSFTAILGGEDFPAAIRFLCSICPLYQLNHLGDAQDTSSILKVVIANVAFIAANMGIGILAFKKSDIK